MCRMHLFVARYESKKSTQIALLTLTFIWLPLWYVLLNIFLFFFAFPLTSMSHCNLLGTIWIISGEIPNVMQFWFMYLMNLLNLWYNYTFSKSKIVATRSNLGNVYRSKNCANFVVIIVYFSEGCTLREKLRIKSVVNVC